ncbi:AGAP002322-PA-like protein [Anopheles sinensis]|uniref:AGAP002322-PA-like protein n=1 Tax=Anopheles sinensis TaxID=74873 RepID=A0A084VXD2_ANOSI|nr:AGAP002322-PA-like protein [Anopheles sinensis]
MCTRCSTAVSTICGSAVSGVDAESPAEVTGLKVGDCVLEVNNEDVLGMRIAEVAGMVRAKSDIVTLLLWSTGMEPACNPESLCCGPMPINLERLTASMQTIVAALECPVCFDTIPPPVFQCQNGHLVCSKCRVRADRCAICRERYTPGRSLLAEQVYQSITEAFNLREGSDGRLRERLFGARCPRPVKKSPYNSDSHLVASGRPIHSHTHKFLARIMGKASSVDNLSKHHQQLSPDADVGDLQGSKGKSLSLSSSEIFKRDNSVSVLRCPSANRLAPELSASYNSLTVRRPTSSMSCNVSVESLGSIPENGIQLTVPVLHPFPATFHCPCGEYCSDLISAPELQQHVTVHHRTPVISFGTASAEISLPPRTPVDNACLLLLLDGHKFWLKLISDTSTIGDIFLSALLEGSPELSKSYALEVIIRKEGFDHILGKELISRSEVHSMVDKSWNDLVNTKAGVFYTGVCIRATFSPDTEILLKASIKRLADL